MSSKAGTAACGQPVHRRSAIRARAKPAWSMRWWRATRGWMISVSYTTRAPRPGEVDGRALSLHRHPAALNACAMTASFWSTPDVFDHLYGTHAGTTRDILASGRDVVLEIDWQGARQVRASFPGCHSIFILPPSLDTLRARLGQRGQDSAAVIDGRMAKARAEISHCHEFDYVIVNDDFQQALQELRSVVEDCRKGKRAWLEQHRRSAGGAAWKRINWKA